MVFLCTLRLESRYRYYPINQCDEALVIAMSEAIVMSKPAAKKTYYSFFSCYGWTLTTAVASAEALFFAIATVKDMAISLTIAIAYGKTISKATAADKMVDKAIQ